VRETIISSNQEAKYYSITFDTTPDKEHILQMSRMFMFAEIQLDSVEITKASIDFIPVDVKTAGIITAEITKRQDEMD
jgi:hypothetical protein